MYHAQDKKIQNVVQEISKLSFHDLLQVFSEINTHIKERIL